MHFTSPGFAAEMIDEKQAQKSRLSMVVIIDGDGSYVYHDNRGNEQRTDQQVLRVAVRVAIRYHRAEVNAYLQLHTRFALFFIPLSSGEYHYYIKGKLL